MPHLVVPLSQEWLSADRDDLLIQMHDIMVKTHLLSDCGMSADDARLVREINEAAGKYFNDAYLFNVPK